MNTLKNAALLVVMGGVLYFVYVTLGKAPPKMVSPAPYQHESMIPPAIEIGPPARPLPAAPLPLLSQAPSAPQLPPPPAAAMPPLSSYAPPLPPDAAAPPVATVPTLPPALPLMKIGPPATEYVPPSTTPDIIPPTPATTHSPAAPLGSDYAVTEVPPAAPTQLPPAELSPETRRSVYELNPAESAGQVKAATATSDTASAAALAGYAFQQDFHAAEAFIAAGRYRDALAKLTPHYRKPELAPTDQEALNRWLDALAGKVIFSQEHHLTEPYTARPTETLLSIAARHKIPWQLLQNINQIRDPHVLVNGTVLKIVPGPFRAEVNLSRHDLTLFWDELYAGRFACSFGDKPPAPGDYQIKDKSRDKAYYGDERTIEANDPSNPYGGFWMDLGGTNCLHGSASAGRGAPLGCVSFSPQDARDVFGILSITSNITVKH